MSQLLFQAEPDFAFRPYMYFEYQSTFLLYRHDRQQFLAFHNTVEMSLPNIMVDLNVYRATEPRSEILKDAIQPRINLKHSQLFELRHRDGLHLIFASHLTIQKGSPKDLMQSYAIFTGEWQQLH